MEKKKQNTKLNTENYPNFDLKDVTHKYVHSFSKLSLSIFSGAEFTD